MHVDDVGLRIEVIVPDVLEKHGPGDDLAGMLDQVLEQPELARLQGHGTTRAADTVAETVELEIADPVHRLHVARLAAPRQCLDAGEQFGEGIGLGEIIVAAGAQAGDAVVDLAEGRKDQRRRAVAVLP